MPENPLDFLKKLLPPLPFGEFDIAAGPPDPFELLKKLLPPPPFGTTTVDNIDSTVGAASALDEDIEVF